MNVTANGIDMHCVVEGEGPWLVLAHSLACNVHMWDEEAKHLARRYRVLRYDARGHGGTQATPGAYTLDLLADDLHCLLEAIGARRVHFVGLSMGGMIGQSLALKYPHCLETLTLCDTTSRYPGGIAEERMARIRLAREKGMKVLVDPTLARWVTQRFIEEQPAAVERLKRMIEGTSVDGYVGCTQANMQVDFTSRLHEIRCPAHIVVGELDFPTPIGMAEEMHRAMAGSRLSIIPGAPHLSNIEKPDAFREAVERFLAQHEQTS